MGAVLIAAVVSGSIYALVSLGFAIAFRLSGVFNFTHGILLIIAAYLDYSLSVYCGFPTWLAIASALALAAGFGFLIEAIIIPTAKNIGLRALDLLVLSWLGLLIIQNLLSMIFSNASIYLGVQDVRTGWIILGSGITPIQLFIIVVSLLAGVTLFLFGRIASAGWEVLAVGDDLRLAVICGINVSRVLRMNALAAAALTAGAGVLLCYQERLDPSLGMRFSIIGIVSTLAGFRFGPAGAVLGGLALALIESAVLYLVDPALRNVAVYTCLFAVVLWTYRRSVVPKE